MYGFTHPPYMSLAFLIHGVFFMDFIRKKLIVETKHFLKFKNSTDIKYPWAVGPFTIKNKTALPMIENLLKEMGFLTEPAVDYDPHQVISNRIKAVKRNHLNHLEVVGLANVANWNDYPKKNPKDTDV